ncbi:AcrR family transcriptional regulator [Actinoplanes lutulentus]|uniref:TetR family transcriptional regulator n=1 Tax=Actinoplanes lutulentus TaxID=1287878 RepID=A0A327YY80_9ACTN|nr:TetR/AcrR family transcriptional regulator [Actinoplanes lutulentus]MBB2947521.1 AcrR family transcriptional regulator [Actinoplanes lutulentus]RAK25677.1 TetR family transcriptional regulator [Actinoplanes lutulentus]
MAELTRRTSGVRHGGRSAQVVDRVRAAVLAEITRLGFAGITIDGVAKAAGVNRTTIYRRWPTKAELLGAVAEPILAELGTDPATGSFRGDLLVLMRRLRDSAARPEGRLLSDAIRSSAAELQDLVTRASVRTLGPFERAAERAVARGEIGDAARAAVAAHLAFSGLVMWEQVRGAPAGDADCVLILETVLGPA